MINRDRIRLAYLASRDKNSIREALASVGLIIGTDGDIWVDVSDLVPPADEAVKMVGDYSRQYFTFNEITPDSFANGWVCGAAAALTVACKQTVDIDDVRREVGL